MLSVVFDYLNREQLKGGYRRARRACHISVNEKSAVYERKTKERKKKESLSFAIQ